MTAIIVLSIIGVILVIAAVALICMAFGGPASTGNGAGVMGGLIFISLAFVSGVLGLVSLAAALIVFLINLFS